MQEPAVSDSPVDSPADSLADSLAPAEAPPALLVRRVRALEAVVSLERKLRRRNEQTTRELRQRLAQLPATATQDTGTDAAVFVSASASAFGSVTPGALAGVISHSTQSGASSASCAASASAPAATSSVASASAPAVTSSAFDPDATRIATPRHEQSGAEAESLALPPGFMLHEYRIDRLLGQGGFGITYLATDVNLNTLFAVKEYMPAAFAARAPDFSVFPRFAEDNAGYYGGLDSFLREARTLASFRHPNIVRVARFFEAHHTAYIVLEYERGQSLKEWWPAQKDLPESELLALLQPLLDGLAQVHETGYLHRDIKPDNILLRELDGSMVLLDFGAARQSGGSEALEAVLTPGYAPKEQYLGEAQGPWTDIYAVGATLYWLVTGSKPLSAPERIAQTLPSAQALGRGRFSETFLQAIDWALQAEAEARPQSMAEFCARLFAAHSATLGLQEALRLGEADGGKRGGRQLVQAGLQGGQRAGQMLWQRILQFAHLLAHPGSWRLLVKMTLAMVLAALLPMTLTAYYNLKGSVASVSASELRNLERLAQATSGRVAQLLGDSRHLANFVSLDSNFVAYLRAPGEAGRLQVQATISQLLANNPDVHRVILLDRQGTALISNDPAVTGSQNRFRQYFREAIAGRPFITGMVVSHIDQTAGVYYANPVFDENHQVLGVIVVRIKDSTVAAILNDSTVGTGRQPFLVDGDGILIYYPDSRYLYRSLMPLSPAKAQEIAQDRRFGTRPVQSLGMPDLARALLGAKTHGNLSYQSSLSGTQEHAGYAPVAGHNWVVGITEPRTQFEAPLNRLFQNVLWSVIVVGLLFMLLAWLFARSIVRPVLRLTQAANALKQGDFDKATIEVGSDDEIGRLARTFNVMIDVLRQRERERRQSSRGRHGSAAGAASATASATASSAALEVASPASAGAGANPPATTSALPDASKD